MRNFRIKPSEKLTHTIYFAVLAVLLLSGCATQMSDHHASGESGSPSLVEVKSISMSNANGQAKVLVQGSKPLAYTAVKQMQPFGVVLYFQNARLNVKTPDLTSDGNPVTSVHASQTNGSVAAARLEILLAADVPYDVKQDGDMLSVQFGSNKRDTSSGISVADVATTSKPTVVDSAKPTQSIGAPAPQPTGTFQGTGENIEARSPIWVNRIDFLGEPGGRSTLSIETTAQVDYNVEKISDRLIELRLNGANIAEFRQRPLITTRFESAVNRIMPVQLPSMRDYSMFSIELREPVAYYVEQVGTLLLVHFESSSVPPAPVDEANLPAWKKALEQAVGPVGLPDSPANLSSSPGNDVSTVSAATEDMDSEPTGFDTADDILIDADQAMTVTRRVKRYTGEKIALDFYQTDVKNVFRILREVSGKNFAIDKDVQGKVTLTLDKPVPWDQVMDLVLRMNQLGMIVEGDIIRIATLATLKRENELRKAQIASLQKEKQQLKALEPMETRYIPVSYSDAAGEVLPHIKNIITKDRGSVTVDAKNNQIIITDTADKIAQAYQIVKNIDKVTSQVVIEARIVEISESYSKELGFEWGFDLGPISMNDGGSEYSGAVAMNYPASSTNGFGINYAKIAGTPFTLDAALTALESSGNGKILSAPKILTLNNKIAKIKQGQEIGYLERDSAGGSSVSFKDVDLSLEVTPHVTPDDRIALVIKIQKNDVSGYVDGVPVISTNEAQTQLLVNDGDTIVIGGIIKTNEATGKSGFPGLHEIPVLGWMFQSNVQSQDNSELLIFLNPKIVQLEQRNPLI